MQKADLRAVILSGSVLPDEGIVPVDLTTEIGEGYRVGSHSLTNAEVGALSARLDARAIANALVKYSPKSGLDLSSLVLVVETGVADTAMAVLRRLRDQAHLNLETSYQPLEEAGIAISQQMAAAERENLVYWLEHLEARPRSSDGAEVEAQLDSLLDDVLAVESEPKREPLTPEANEQPKREPVPTRKVVNEPITAPPVQVETEKEPGTYRLTDEQIPAREEEPERPIPISQQEALDTLHRRTDELREDQRTAYATGALDSDDADVGMGATTATASFPEPQNEQRVPRFMEEARRRDAELKRQAEMLVPNPPKEQVQGDVSRMLTQDGGLPKEEASSEGAGTPTAEAGAEAAVPVRDEVLRETLPTEVKSSGVIYSDEDGLDSLLMADVESDSSRETLGMRHTTDDYGPQMRADNYEANRRRRLDETIVISVTGGAGGSGKTTLAYAIWLASVQVDLHYPKRRDQETWLLEADIGSPKWKTRSNMQTGFTTLVQEVVRRNGNVSDAELIELAREHANDGPKVSDRGPAGRQHILAAPDRKDFDSGLVTADQFYLVLKRLVRALYLNRENPSTVIVDHPDYEGEALRGDMAQIINGMSDKIVVSVYAIGKAMADAETLIESIREQKHNAVTSGDRLLLAGARVRTQEVRDQLEGFGRRMQVPYIGSIGDLPELRQEMSNVWAPNSSRATLAKLVDFGIYMLARGEMNGMAKHYWRWRAQKMREAPAKNEAANQARQRAAGQHGGVVSKIARIFKV